MKIGKIRIILNNFLLSVDETIKNNTPIWPISLFYWVISIDIAPTQAYTNLINNLTIFTKKLASLNAKMSLAVEHELQLARFLFNPEIKTLSVQEKNSLKRLENNLKEEIPNIELYRVFQKILLNEEVIKLAKMEEVFLKDLFMVLRILKDQHNSLLNKLFNLKVIDIEAYLKGKREDNTLLFSLLKDNDLDLSALLATLIGFAEQNIIGENITFLACDAFTSQILSLDELAKIFSRLQSSGLINNKSLEVLRKNGAIWISQTEDAFILLLKAGLFFPEYISLLAHKKTPEISAQILIKLDKLSFLNAESGAKALDYPQPNIMIMALDIFIDAAIPVTIDDLFNLLHINTNYLRNTDRKRNIVEKISAYIYLYQLGLPCPIEEFNHGFIMCRLPTILSILAKFEIQIDSALFNRIKNLNPNLQDILISRIHLSNLTDKDFVKALGSIDNLAEDSISILQVSNCSKFPKAPLTNVVKSNAKVNIRESSELFDSSYKPPL